MCLLKHWLILGYLFLINTMNRSPVRIRDCLKITKIFRWRGGIALAKKYESDFEAEAYFRAALKVNPNLVLL